ncbi:Transcriptional regulator, AbiEi antitoxin, Type IV TA system [Ectothiorhodosinus mongolicus]|uniref:Transcriptional regulator, AbiEi antitoxin, Type IV TA system n=1 Tax=Ectothiorhodosinus mongolicus TaxID=233100 RepID=A0A1R3VR16_9GAMM|nr:hypothetical protein [Ectothiorhodosinus mongolicus]ULX56752.1 hypothetical protein CKX93_02915 [Ectothiorhodosinus mongolicus]SIT67125.1 Transcriptional regulator, AbiEi antitoxin, Type IV TA system [Ectothiorhodosinus mongolicus]
MQTLTQTVIHAGFGTKVLHDAQLAILLEGSAQRRYNLVNRALKAGELVRLKRGCYVLHPTVTGTKVHGFVVAQHLQPGSFISFETALAWHGWIPEAVRLMASVVPGRRKAEYSLPVWGDFRFVPLAQNQGYGLVGVGRIELSSGIGLVADPLRALLDLICWRKIAPEWVPSFLQGLRLEPEWQSAVQSDALIRLRRVYQHRRMTEVIDCIASEYAHD